MLLNLYAKPLGEIICSSEIGCHQYADDTRFSISLSNSPGSVVDVLSHCLNVIVKCLKANKLNLNPEKAEVMLAGKAEFLKDIFNGVQLTWL